MGIRFALFAEQNGKKFLLRMLHLMSPLTPLGDTWSGILRRLSSSRQNGTVRQSSPRYNITEPTIFDDDDEILDPQTSITHHVNDVDHSIENTMETTTYPEVSAVSKPDSHKNFTVLVHLKAPPISTAVTGAMLNLQLRPLNLSSSTANNNKLDSAIDLASIISTAYGFRRNFRRRSLRTHLRAVAPEPPDLPLQSQNNHLAVKVVSPATA
ncbi:hypothetical protein KIW84_043150 [Lathyrus oleraceus]|uniref:Uncharacterized protein n=1 Tax=Pisum sativum TaxID=3888 RepID=A0A9D4XH65_PEA|nr:hypothetical protein KIW84_043150 [Pisum sativum]